MYQRALGGSQHFTQTNNQINFSLWCGLIFHFCAKRLTPLSQLPPRTKWMFLFLPNTTKGGLNRPHFNCLPLMLTFCLLLKTEVYFNFMIWRSSPMSLFSLRFNSSHVSELWDYSALLVLAWSAVHTCSALSGLSRLLNQNEFMVKKTGCFTDSSSTFFISHSQNLGLVALEKRLHLLCAWMTSLLEISTDIIGVILDTRWEIIPLISALRWALRDHLFLKPRHGLLAGHSLLSQALDCPQICIVWLMQRTVQLSQLSVSSTKVTLPVFGPCLASP